MKLMVIICCAAISSAQAMADECKSDTIRRLVKDDNRGMPYKIVTAAGKNLRLLGQDSINPHEWHPGDCIEVGVDPQGHDTFDLFNTRTGQTLVAQPDKGSATKP